MLYVYVYVFAIFSTVFFLDFSYLCSPQITVNKGI